MMQPVLFSGKNVKLKQSCVKSIDISSIGISYDFKIYWLTHCRLRNLRVSPGDQEIKYFSIFEFQRLEYLQVYQIIIDIRKFKTKLKKTKYYTCLN